MASVDPWREKSYQIIYQAQSVELDQLRKYFHGIISLPQSDMIWRQAVNRVLFNQALVALNRTQGKSNSQIHLC